MKRRYSIWDEIQRMHEQMDALFENFFTGRDFTRSDNLLPQYSGSGSLVKSDDYREPLTNIHETDKEYIMTVELPGIDKKDIQLDATDDGVEIKVEHKEESKKEDKKGDGFSYSNYYSGFYKYFPLPEGIKADDIKASYKNGVLELKIPKTNVKKKVKRINLE